MLPAKLTRNQLGAGICFTLVLVTAALYWPMLHHDFINFDDHDYITENPRVIAGLTWSGIVWAFQSGYSANWHPLTWLSHMLDCQLYGLNPAGHHSTNLLFHIANTVLLFLLLRQLTGAVWRSAFVAALFAWHPLHVESVAWAAERKDVLSAFFWLLALMAYARYVTSDKWQVTRSSTFWSRVTCHVSPYYLLALFFFACGLMSKPMVVTLPFVLLLLDYWPLKRFPINGSGPASSLHHSITPPLRLLLEKLPFFALALAGCVTTYFVQKASGALWPTPLAARLENVPLTYARYLSKTFRPVDLAVSYPWGHPPAILVLGSVLLLAALTALSFWRARQNPYLPVGWFWFLGTLIPTIGLVQVGMQSMADRYTYIPGIGLFVAVVWGLPALFDSWLERRKWLPLAGGVALLGCLLVTSRQLSYWRNSTSLFSHAIGVTTDNYVADVCLGEALANAGQKDRALALYTEAVRLEPRYPQGQFDLAMSLLDHGQPAEAREHFEAAARLVPHDAGAQYELGSYYFQQNNLDQAVPCFQAALRSRPDFPEAHNALGSVFLRWSKLDDAIAQFAVALRLNPDFAQAQRNWGVALSRQGKTSDALTHFSEDVRLRPDDPQARFNYGFALLDNHQPAAAAAQFTEEIRLAPNETGAHFRLAQALSRQHKSSDAIPHYRQTLRLLPDFPDALNELAWILATDPDSRIRSGAEAVQLAERACALTQNQQAAYLSTLSAAYAETGRLPEAIATAQKALDLARTAGQTNIAAQDEELLKQYRAGYPFRETD